MLVANRWIRPAVVTVCGVIRIDSIQVPMVSRTILTPISIVDIIKPTMVMTTLADT